MPGAGPGWLCQEGACACTARSSPTATCHHAGTSAATASAACASTGTRGARPLTDEEAFAKKSLEELNAEKPLGDVFFLYDSAAVSEEGRAALQKNMEWLRKWGSTRVLVEGHCDNRGTPEYNLALGEQRAAAVRDYLVSLGLPATRVTIVSKGEEQPFCNEDAESCSSQNRRDHFLITAK